MSEPIEEAYFNWLRAKVVRLSDINYRDLLVILHKTEFIWRLPSDENRALDGIDLRMEFYADMGYERDHLWEATGCSVFEMLVALSERASFQTDIPARSWFWDFLTNLRLNEMRRVSVQEEKTVKQILHDFVWRDYDDHGVGGLFPLRHPKHDQRTVEIWYQFHEYINERDL